jgi:hypothetical protein
VYRGVRETSRFLGAAELAAVMQQATLAYPANLFLMEEGDEIFDRVSDFLNGVVLLNPTLLPNGRHRPRFYKYAPHVHGCACQVLSWASHPCVLACACMCSDETERFDAFMAKLNTEIAIRNDFVTLALEAVRAMPSAELQANFVSWVDNMGFVGTITTDPRLCSFDDIRPLRLQLVKGGVVGMLDLPAVQDYYAKVAPLCANAKSMPAPAPAEWDAFVRGLGLPDQLLRFVPELAVLDAKLWDHNNRALGAAMQYEPAPVPESASFKYWPSAQTRGQRPIGEHAHDRKQEDQILAALSFLQGEGHLMNIADTVKLEMVPKTFDKYENDVVEASDPAYTQLRQLLDDLIAMPSNSAQRLMEMFKRTVSADLRMLRNALAIKKVKVWVADKRVFFFKNNMDDRIGEGASPSLSCVLCVCVCVCVCVCEWMDWLAPG